MYVGESSSDWECMFTFKINCGILVVAFGKDWQYFLVGDCIFLIEICYQWWAELKQPLDMELPGVGSSTHLLTFCNSLSSSISPSDTPFSFLSFTHSHIQEGNMFFPQILIWITCRQHLKLVHRPQAAYDCTLLTPELDL